MNLWLAAAPPEVVFHQECPLPGLPPPDAAIAALRGSAFAGEVERLAAAVLDHRFSLLGLQIEMAPPIHWRRDYVHGRESGVTYFRLIPYLDCDRAGDHKIIWELNRHQHLVLLAQAFLFTGSRPLFAEIIRQWESWLADNPFQRSVNWASALEVAFRALSWIWVYHFTGSYMEETLRRRFLQELYRHGCHLEHNLSLYFSPNTHLLGEGVALHALGTLFPASPRAPRWKRLGARVVREQLARQVRADGSHFEQSTYYHVYALDFFLLHYLLAGRPDDFQPVLVRMAEYLHAVMGPARTLPLVGDDDGGRLFHPYGRHDRFGRATLATCSLLFDRRDWLHEAEDTHEQAAWWLGASSLQAPAAGAPREAQARLFAQSGTAILTTQDLWVLADAGGFGPLRAGHSHSDALSVNARIGEVEILVDAGTYTYVGSAQWRNWFRSSAAHNTVRVDARDQAVAAGPFAWSSRPEVEIREWSIDTRRQLLDAVCRYRVENGAVVHRRRLVLLLHPQILFVLDDIEGPGGPHLVEQFWHCGANVTALSPHCFGIGPRVRLAIGEELSTSLGEGGENGWHSSVFGRKAPAPVIAASRRGSLPCRLGAILTTADGRTPLVCTLAQQPAGVRMELSGDVRASADFPSREPAAGLLP